jgi:hypothetical protein
VQAEFVNESFIDLEIFSKILSSLGRRKVVETKVQAKGKAIIREATTIPIVRSLREIQTDTVEL